MSNDTGGIVSVWEGRNWEGNRVAEQRYTDRQINRKKYIKRDNLKETGEIYEKVDRKKGERDRGGGMDIKRDTMKEARHIRMSEQRERHTKTDR